MALRRTERQSPLGWLVAALLGATYLTVIALLGGAAYSAVFAKTFILRNDSWTCTAIRNDGSQLTRDILLGKVAIPQEARQYVETCQRYERKAP